MPTIVNWRDASPAVSHDNAIVWSCLQPVDSRAPSNSLGASASVLERLDVMTVHGIQGRKDSDHHKHQYREQVYYIIRGKGKAICGGARCDVLEGDALYLPSGLYHQILNPGEDWVVHPVISVNVAGDGGAFLKSNWRDVAPVSDTMGAMRWRCGDFHGLIGRRCSHVAEPSNGRSRVSSRSITSSNVAAPSSWMGSYNRYAKAI